MDYRDRITIEPCRRGGKPCVRHLRITVSDVLDYLAGGMTQEEILADSPLTSPPTISAPAWPLPPTVNVVSSPLRRHEAAHGREHLSRLVDRLGDLFPGSSHVRSLGPLADRVP